MFSRKDVEDIILCMADIVLENRELRERLAKEESYEKKYNQLLNDVVREAEQSNKDLLKACLLGCFNTGNAEPETETNDYWSGPGDNRRDNYSEFAIDDD